MFWGLHRLVVVVSAMFCPFSAESFGLCIWCCGAWQLKASLFLWVSGSLVLREQALSCTVSALDSAWRCFQMEKPCLEDVLWDIKALLFHCFSSSEMSLSSPEPALQRNVLGHVTKRGLFLPLRVHLEQEAGCKLCALAITVVLLCLLSMQYLWKEKQDKSEKLWPR